MVEREIRQLLFGKYPNVWRALFVPNMVFVLRNPVEKVAAEKRNAPVVMAIDGARQIHFARRVCPFDVCTRSVVNQHDAICAVFVGCHPDGTCDFTVEFKTAA